MAICKNCGEAVNDETKLCSNCGSEQTSDEVVNDVQTTTENTAGEIAEESGNKKKGKLKGKIGDAKNRVVKDGKNAVVTFIIKKVITCLLTVTLSVVTTFFVQHQFKDDFKDYYEETLVPMHGEYMELARFLDVLTAENNNPKAVMEYYEEHDIYNKSIEVLTKAYSYSSDNEDVMRIHNMYIDLFSEIFDFSAKLYKASVISTNDVATVDYGYILTEHQAVVEKIKIKSAAIDNAVMEICKKNKIEVPEAW